MAFGPIKQRISGRLILTMLKHPSWMRSKLFKKLMISLPSKMAPRYDASTKKAPIDYLAPLKDSLAQVPVPKNALDIASGTGLYTQTLVEVFPDTDVHALDASEAMIREAKKKEVLKDVHFKKGDAVNLPYEDSTFELVVTANAPVYLDEIHRILTPDGLAIIAFSFSGQTLLKRRAILEKFLDKENFKLMTISSSHSGIYIQIKKL